ncbi:MAG: hypothetical protein CEN90_570 [Parcubacteria group bacterium Licking1014_17]|nr:MAG: hypothetical protein CEN90_570 [Parcubacteria group bacterium Licking1014_17]
MSNGKKTDSENPSIDARIKLPKKKLIFYLITFVAVFLIFTHQTEFTTVKNLFKESNSEWLFWVVVSQLAAYFLLALNYREVLRIKKTEVPTGELFPLTFIIQFFNQTLPSGGIAGQVFFINYLYKKGFTLAEGIGRAILEMLTLYLAFGVFFLATIALIFREHIIVSHPTIWLFIYAFIFVAILAFGVFFAAQKKSRVRWLEKTVFKLYRFFIDEPSWAKIPFLKNFVDYKKHISPVMNELRATMNIEELRRHAAPFWWATAWQALILVANALTLHFLALALGYRLPLVVSFIAYMLTRFVILTSVVPGALGISEGAMTFALATFGVPLGAAFSITILFRAFTFWLPMPIGWLLYSGMNKQPD